VRETDSRCSADSPLAESSLTAGRQAPTMRCLLPDEASELQGVRHSMKVLYAIDSLAASGAETSLMSMVRPMRQRGIAIEIAYLNERIGLRGELEALGVPLWPAARRGRLVDIVRIIRSRRPDIVHTTLFESDVIGRPAARLARVPVVSSLVNVAYGPEHFRNPDVRAGKLRAAQVLDATTARMATRLHALTDHVADVMSVRLRYPRARIDVVPRGRDPERLGIRSDEHRTTARDRLGIEDGRELVLAASRQEHQKGLDVLLRSFPAVCRTFPRAALVVAGRSGGATPLLRRLVDDLRLADAVRFVGARSDVPDLLCAADAFVLPSRWEGLGSVLLEAMALEAPIVATGLLPVREVLEHDESALLVPVEDPVALADALCTILKDHDRAVAYARRARERFLSGFTIDQIADRMAAFYERALA
jgi:glycosyltransferase involved in cell wall biosynthesis